MMKTFHLHDIDVTGITAYYLRIDYKHKESEPCIRIYRESPSMVFYEISNNSYSMTELRGSPIYITPEINLDVRATNKSSKKLTFNN